MSEYRYSTRKSPNEEIIRVLNDTRNLVDKYAYFGRNGYIGAQGSDVMMSDAWEKRFRNIHVYVDNKYDVLMGIAFFWVLDDTLPMIGDVVAIGAGERVHLTYSDLPLLESFGNFVFRFKADPLATSGSIDVVIEGRE